jgi:hypothetical protein
MGEAWLPKYGISARARRRAQRLAEEVAPLTPAGETLELVAECFVDSAPLEVASGLPGMLGSIPMLFMYFRRRTIWLSDKHLGLLSHKNRQELLVATDAVAVVEFSYLAPAALIVRTPEGRFRFSFIGPWVQHAKELSSRLPGSTDDHR